MAVYFDGAGMQAEEICARQFNGKLVDDLDLQYKDIDVLIKSVQGAWKSVSVKDQLWSSGKYKAIQIETLMTDTRTGAKRHGCFITNESDYYMWRVEWEGVDVWAVMPSKRLKEFIGANPKGMYKWSTRELTEAKNRKYGRTYDRSEGVTIPLSLLKQVVTKIIPVEV